MWSQWKCENARKHCRVTPSSGSSAISLPSSRMPVPASRMTERVGPSRRTHVVLPPNSWYSMPDTDIEPLTPKNFKRMPAPRFIAYCAAGSTAGSALLERFEELPRELPRHAVDEPCAHLRELPPDGGLGVVDETSRAAFRREGHRCLALGEPRHAALARSEEHT